MWNVYPKNIYKSNIYNGLMKIGTKVHKRMKIKLMNVGLVTGKNYNVIFMQTQITNLNLEK